MASNQSSALDTFTTALHSFGKELLCPIWFPSYLSYSSIVYHY